MPAKVITEILDKYATAPKSNMQALEDHELSIVFEHLTQNNQISNIAAIYADEPKKPEAPKVEAPKAEAPKAQPAAAQQTAKPAQQPQQGQHLQNRRHQLQHRVLRHRRGNVEVSQPLVYRADDEAEERRQPYLVFQSDRPVDLHVSFPPFLPCQAINLFSSQHSR